MWPTDLLVFPPGTPGLRAIFIWRICLVAACVVTLVLLKSSPFFRAHPFHLAMVSINLPVFASGWLMGKIGGPEAATTCGVYTAPLLTVLLVVELRPRIAATVSIIVAYFLGLVASRPAIISESGFAAIVVWTVASAITAVIVGHVTYILLRANFRQRRALDRMASQLKTLVGEQSTEIRTLASRISFLQEEERARIAHELHDDLGQTLVSVGMQLEWVQGLSGRTPPDVEKIDSGIRSLRAMVDELHDSLDRVLATLRPRTLETLGFDLAVTRLAQDLGRQNGFAAEVEIGVDTDDFSPAASVVIFRIIQQALTNISRHARAGRAGISLSLEEGSVVLRIVDDGVGFDPSAVEGKGRMGLMGIRERSLLLKGDCRIESAPGKGCRIVIAFPAGRLISEVPT
jgi:signal transduction histidine kinase